MESKQITTNINVGLKTFKFTKDTPLILGWYNSTPFMYSLLGFTRYYSLYYPEIIEWQWMGMIIFSNEKEVEKKIKDKLC